MTTSSSSSNNNTQSQLARAAPARPSAAGLRAQHAAAPMQTPYSAGKGASKPPALSSGAGAPPSSSQLQRNTSPSVSAASDSVNKKSFCVYYFNN
ncbi:hypothetical protein B5X24_HaOG214179 [Helicoverpa armigera]|nr:hypothetical protein B5X24_HaOG214179 [Helicoverpa armigera]